ncbi:uncharacterized protein LOC142494702 [Ascaphus truei]|uniref:uncharacterized protein LOC142494702 n=2 Tax=Ascaphus truei TaxID=8439 RepID=UPI003F592CC0
MWDTIVIGVNACGNSVRDKYHCRKRFDDIRSKLKKKIQDQRVHATGTGGGPTPQRLILTPLEELLRPKLLTVVVEGLAGDRDIGIYPSQFPAVAPEGHVSPEMEQVSSPGSASSTLLEEHHGDEDDEYDEDDATEETEIQSCDHEEVPIETVVPPNRPSTSTYDAIVASEGKIVDAENRRHSDMMTVLERMIGLQEETVSQLAHLHRVFIEVPKQLQKINTSFEALVVQQTQANYWRMTNVPQFNTSQPGSVHAGQFSPHSSDIHSPGPNVTGQVADIAVQVPDDILPLPSVQIQQQTPTKEATKTKQDTHETDQPSLVQCLPTCSHVSLGTSPVREQSLPKSPVGESLPKSPVGESLPKSPVGVLNRTLLRGGFVLLSPAPYSAPSAMEVSSFSGKLLPQMSRISYAFGRKVKTAVKAKREEAFDLLFAEEPKIPNVPPSEKVSMKEHFKNLEKMLITESKQWDNEHFMKEWIRILDECSNDLVRLIIYERSKSLKELGAQIEEQIKTMEPLIINTDCSELEHDVCANLEQHDDETAKTKHFKFFRDKHDYDTNKQRTWAKDDGKEMIRKRHGSPEKGSKTSENPRQVTPGTKLKRPLPEEGKEEDPGSKRKEF